MTACSEYDKLVHLACCKLAGPVLPARCPLCVDTDNTTVDGRTPGTIEEDDDLLANELERYPPYDHQPLEEVAGKTGTRENDLELVAALEPQQPLLPPAGQHRASPAGDPEGKHQANGEEDADRWKIPDPALALVLEKPCADVRAQCGD